MTVINKVKETILKHQLLEKSDHVITALSGGPDSVCLLHCLLFLREDLEITVSAVHVNHQLRGAAADQDQAYVQQLCEQLDIPLTVYSYNVASIAKERCIGVEDAGRKLRYASFFARKAELEEDFQTGGGCRRVLIAVAHNQGDQAETVLMRIMRGTGISGLSGMEYQRSDGVIRPLLDVERAEIEKYCEENSLQPRTDATNLKNVYTRNRIRLELIPYMEKYFNPAVIEALNRLSSIAREETAFIDDMCSELLKQRIFCDKEVLCLPLTLLAQAHPAVRKRVLQKILAELGLEQNIGAVHLRQAETLLSAPKRSDSGEKIVEFPQGYRMKRTGTQALFYRNEEDGSQKTGKPEEKNASNGILKETLVKNDGTVDWKRTPVNIRCFDWEAVRRSGVLPTLRTRRAGDFIQPLGMRGTKKLQDYFVDRKVPREQRDQIPLVCMGAEVLWIIGGQISERFKVTDESESILILEYADKI